MIGRDHQRAARIDEELVFGTDENLHTVSLGGRVEKTKRVLPRLQLVKQLPDGIQLLAGLNIIEKIGLAPHHQHRLVSRAVTGPQSDTGLDKTLRDLVEFCALRRDFGADQACGRCQVAPRQARVHIVAGPHKRRLRHTRRQIDQPVFHLAVHPHQHGQRTVLAKRNKFEMLQLGIAGR